MIEENNYKDYLKKALEAKKKSYKEMCPELLNIKSSKYYVEGCDWMGMNVIFFGVYKDGVLLCSNLGRLEVYYSSIPYAEIKKKPTTRHYMPQLEKAKWLSYEKADNEMKDIIDKICEEIKMYACDEIIIKCMDVRKEKRKIKKDWETFYKSRKKER